MSMRGISAVLFDLDDTLLDRPRSLRELARRFIRTFPGDLAAQDGERVYQAWTEADASGYKSRSLMAKELLSSVKWRHAPPPAEIEAFWQREFPSCSVLEDGAEALLTFLKGNAIKTGVVTNSKTEFQKAKIAHVDLGKHLDLVIISEYVGLWKPDPRIFMLAMERLGTTPDRTVFVGDNPEADIAGARNVGMHVIWKKARLPWPENLTAPERSVEKLGEITAMLRDSSPGPSGASAHPMAG
jgi:putative hydrolase of the HAD superfamily